MKRLLFLLFLLTGFNCFSQTTYYISKSGSDNSTGKSANNAIKTIDKLNTINFVPGDKILFRCSDTFTGQVKLNRVGSSSGKITLGSFGAGTKPVITGAEPVLNWQKVTGRPGVWVAACNQDTVVTNVFKNGVPLPLGRYPNRDAYNHGYLTVAGHNGKTQITSKEAVSGNWTGAQLVFKPNEFLIEKPEISGQDGNTFTVKNEQLAAYDGWGFFIQNALNTLDENGEWYFNSREKKIYVFEKDGDPNGQDIAYASFKSGIRITNSQNIIINNLQISGSASSGIFISASKNISLSHLAVNYSGDDGVVILNSIKPAITGSTISFCNNNGVIIRDSPGFSFTGNILKNCATIPGRGKADNGAYVGFQCFGRSGDGLVKGNVVQNIGYNAIEVRASNVIVAKNNITNFCLIKGDGGGIYTWNGGNSNLSGIQIIRNVITGGQGDTVSTNHLVPHISGIYMDDCSANDVVSGNTITDCTNAGIFLHGALNILVDSNVCYNNLTQYIAAFGGCLSTGNKIINNTFVCKSKSQRNVLLLTNGNNASMGTFDNNRILSPNNDRVVLLVTDTRDHSKDKAMSYDQFKNTYRQERSSKNPLSLMDGSSGSLIQSNLTARPRTIRISGNYKTADGKPAGKQITLQPFSSMVLIGK